MRSEGCSKFRRSVQCALEQMFMRAMDRQTIKKDAQKYSRYWSVLASFHDLRNEVSPDQIASRYITDRLVILSVLATNTPSPSR